MNSEKKPTEIVGVILAGGNALRLGVALKASIKVGGITLLQRVYNAIERHCDHLILSVGTHAFADYNANDEMTPVSDTGIGPAAAMVASAKYAAVEFPKARYLLSVAVDTPFFPSDFAPRAQGLMTSEQDVIVAAHGGQVYPTNALWRLSSFTRSVAISASQNPPRALFGLLDERRWGILDYADLCPTNPFSNINTPTDLIASNRRVAEKQG